MTLSRSPTCIPAGALVALLAATALSLQAQPAAASTAPDSLGATVTNSIGMRFVSIPAGIFMMGAVDHDRQAGPHEKPRHRVTISRPFYIAQHEVWGGPVVEIKAGGAVWCPPGVTHWHGAAPGSAMTHLALTGQKDGQNVAWVEKVSEEQYGR